MRRVLYRYILPLLSLLCLDQASAQVVLFSHDGGFHADTFSLGMRIELAPAGESLAIHYTLNGNTPTECDPLYTSPLPLSQALYSNSEAFKIQNVPDDRWFQPDSVERIIVVRAAVFDTNGVRRSPVEHAQSAVLQLPNVARLRDVAAL